MKRINVSIEARMTSSRLPGKVLMEVCGKSMLELMIERVRHSKYVDKIIVATTTNETDNPIIELCDKLKTGYFRGSEPDVLKRVYEAHNQYHSNLVVELTGDCPLIDPLLIDHCILEYLNGDYDYVRTSQTKTYPWGQAVQVYSFELLKYLNENAITEYDREHVTPHIYQNPDKYRIKEIHAKESHTAPDMRLTLDTQEDFEFITAIYERLYPSNPLFSLEEMIVVGKEIIGQ